MEVNLSKNGIKDSIKDLLLTLPEKPGVYRFYSNIERLLYIGKAKNIKKRINTYLTKNK